MEAETKTCCVTGHRDIPAEKKGLVEEALRREVAAAIEDCQRRAVKNLKRRTENDPNAGNIASVIYAGTPSAGQLSVGSSAGGTGWTPAFHRSRSR